MITAVIPVLNQNHYTDSLLNDISNNVVKPERIILIDDGSEQDVKQFCDKYNSLPIDYIRHDENKGVNYSWNEGVKMSDTPLVSILNNDIILNEFFFKKIIQAYKKQPGFAVVCPNTLKPELIHHVKEKVKGYKKPQKKKVPFKKSFVMKSIRQGTQDVPVLLSMMKKREGWAWTANMNTIGDLFPIPTFLRTFCGDRYIFEEAEKKNLKWFKMTNNIIYHHISETVRYDERVCGDLEQDRNLYKKWRQDGSPDTETMV